MNTSHDFINVFCWFLYLYVVSLAYGLMATWTEAVQQLVHPMQILL